MAPLTTLQIGQEAQIRGLDPDIKQHERRRLLDLGITPGTPIRHCFDSASGDPKAYEVMGSVIALRKEQAEKIYLD
jgi:DtxR family Mn-dependent transcriptional regulator